MTRKSFCKTFAALTLLVSAIGYSVAQNYQEIRLKGTFPIGDFDRVGETAEMASENLIGSGAADGISLGYRYSFNLGGGIFFNVGGDIMWNNTSARYRKICWDYNNETAPNYFNFPAWVGVQLRTPLFGSKRFSAYFGACGGFNIHYTTSTGWKNFEVRYKPAISPGLLLETGLSYRQYSLGIELLTLGKPTIKGVGEETHHKFKTLNKNRHMLMGNIVFSYKLVKQKREWRPARKSVLEM